MKQKFKIIQKQKISTKQIQSVKVLQLSQQDLDSFIEDSLVDNPFSDLEQSNVEFEIKDNDYKKVSKKTDEQQSFEFIDEDENDLMGHVLPQLEPFIKTRKDRESFTIILESLDDRGFLGVDQKDLLNYLNIDKEKLVYYLDCLKNVHPLGLGTKNMQECILFQLHKLSNSSLSIKIMEQYLEKVGVGDVGYIAKSENVEIEVVKKAIEQIQSLNPIPANGFRVNSKTLYIVPDVYIEREGDNISIEMNNSIRNKLTLNKENYETFKNSKFKRDEKKFLTQKLNDFKWLQYSADRRIHTLQKIITYLVDFQKDYFLTGDENRLKPLRLIDVSDAVNLHSSTISRAVSNKYFRCEYGFYPFRHLMPKTYKKKSEKVSSLTSIDTLKGEIKEIISLEDKRHPLSDEKIKQILQEEGYDVSRRSVTLYRNECFIPSSKNRRIKL